MDNTSKNVSELQRYGLEWKSETDFVCHPMNDGYWTPWHIAEDKIAELRRQLQSVEAELVARINASSPVMELEVKSDRTFCPILTDATLDLSPGHYKLCIQQEKGDE